MTLEIITVYPQVIYAPKLILLIGFLLLKSSQI